MEYESSVSRRCALRLIAAIPAAIAGAAPVLARAQSIDALKAQYRFRHFPNGRQKCFGCSNYTRLSRGAGDCSVLDTQVNWEGWCTAWRAKAG
ncbi:MAG TPA: high-potential iron-sulfur protein [Candidatus Limnocylindria bacterium]|jgi:hypothetical protein|nr:high-potential iron-sulfur protein [Candidatus Limnocylindria bacterium]